MHEIFRDTRETSIPPMKSGHSFRFGDATVIKLEMIELVIETPDALPGISVLMNIVPFKVSTRLGLDVLDAFRP